MRNVTASLLVALMMLISAVPLLAFDAAGTRWEQTSADDFAAGESFFIETSGGASPVTVTSVTRSGGDLIVTVDGLTNGTTYHLAGSSSLSGFAAIAGTDVVATGSGDVLTATVGGPTYFVQVVEGAAP